MNRWLVVPTNRPERLAAFFEAWKGKGGWDTVCIVCDAEERFVGCGIEHQHGRIRWLSYSHKEIAEELGSSSWIISRKDSACRAFGFLKAYKEGAEYVLTLDDDCYPGEYNVGQCTLYDSHLWNLNARDRWSSSVHGLRVRGLPYRNVGRCSNVAVSVGLWTGVPDLDAQTQLRWRKEGWLHEPPAGTRLLPAGEYTPISGMNLCMKRYAVPLWYYPPMGEGQPYSRFDDIWAGVVLKKVCDRIGWSISVGEPFVHHQRASSVEANLLKEAPGIEAHERYWEIIDSIPLFCHDPSGCMREIAAGLQRTLDPYLRRWGLAIHDWERLLC